MILALTAFKSTFGLILIWLVILPVLAQGLIGFAVLQVLGERAENKAYEAGERPPLHE